MFCDWFVGYLNFDNEKVNHCVISAPTENEARHDFFEIYRHHRYKIICCIPYREYISDTETKLLFKYY